MKIQYMSDLHLEHQAFAFLDCDADVIVLAGDIASGDRALAWITESLPKVPVIYVLGNHEFYGHSFPSLNEQIELANSNPLVHVLNRKIVTIDGINFLGCTLWTDFELFEDPEGCKDECQRYMNDYHYIKSDDTGRKLMPDETAHEFKLSKTWLEKSLSEHKGENNIVVTHQAPSIKSILPKYKDDKATAGFASNLEDLIERHEPNLWFHGHVHNQVDVTIGQTRVLCNPRGYPREDSRELFDPVRYIELFV